MDNLLIYKVALDGILLESVTYSDIEMSVYLYNRRMFEIWFDTVNDKVLLARNPDTCAIDPFLKYMGVSNN